VVPYYPWWEDEATTVLWAFKNLEIRLVIRYGLFRDENLPRSSLLSRNVDAIDAVFMALTEPREHQLLGHLSHMQRVEEILRRSGLPPFQPVPWSWLPQTSVYALDPRAIAQAIEAESHFQLSRVAFEDIVRASLGYTATSVEWFLMQHTALYIHLLDHLRMFPDDIPVYLEVEKVWFSFVNPNSYLTNIVSAPTNKEPLRPPSDSTMFNCSPTRFCTRSGQDIHT
jgi:hypothetical protein